MDCKHFGTCGSCLYNNYEKQLSTKVNKIKNEFSEFIKDDIEIFESPKLHFRSRVEFRIFKSENLSYAMFDRDKKFLLIDECKIVDEKIANLMPKFLDRVEKSQILREKIYAVEFLVSSFDILVTMIYHKKLNETWQEEAKELEEEFNINIIGRSKKQKVILSKDFIYEELNLEEIFKYKFYEGGFTQPNSFMNKNMISWAMSNSNTQGDLLELYCGAGNFTLPLSTKFNRVLATEISKTSIKSALENVALNNITNIDFVRLSAEEFTEALNKEREFNRLKGVDLDSYNFSTIFVDPPRAGLDNTTRNLSKQFENIIYISCNPTTLKRDLEELTKTHKVEKFALFDQFPYTNHIESGVVLKKI